MNMTKITKSELYALKIEALPGLNELLDRYFPHGQMNNNFMPVKKVPCVVYKEYITGINGLSVKPFERRIIYARTNHDGLQGSVLHSLDRNILSLRVNGIDDSDRGKILVAFCELEFILDILICYNLGVYDGLRTYREVQKGLFSHGCTLSNFEDKRSYLYYEGLIDKLTSDELKTVQSIRNKIAHNYFLDKNMGFNDATIAFYGSVSEAIEIKFNYAWFLLMNTYNVHQPKVIRWAYGDE